MALPAKPLALYWEYYKDNITITNASPAVFTAKTGGSTSNHGLGAGTAIL